MIAALNAAANAALTTRPVQQTMHAAGVRVQGGTADQLGRLLDAETKRWAQVIARAGIERQ